MSAVASRLRCRLGDRFHGSSLSRLRPLRRYLPAAAPLAPQQNLQQRRRESWGMGVPLQPLQPFQAQRRWSSSSPMPGGCLETYLQMKANGEIQVDPRQEVCMKMLDDLAKQIDGYSPKMTRASKPAASVPSGGGGFFGLFGGSKAPPPKAAKAADAPLQPVAGQKGLYLWGGTGTGKTFMMNMFYDKIKVRSKKRIHFHEWMIDVHSRLHKKQKGSSSKTDSSADDMVEQVAADMMKEAWLLCFDEFQVTHISDAIIMKRIFSVLFELGAVVVATSNRPPQDLYLNGLNRPLFLPFIPMLEAFTNVHDIGAEVDYRMCSTRDDDDDRVYLTPNGENEKKALEAKFQRVSHGLVREGVQVESQGRRIVVPRCAKHSDVAFFSFVDLCDKPLGAADYLAVGHAFHTVFVADIPRLTMQDLELSPGEEPNVKELRERLKEVEEALESEKRLREHSQESLRECKEVAARFMADRDATRTELEELTHLASAFKTQAESELSENRWFRLATQLRRRSEDDTFERLKGSWSHGFRKWQSFADTLMEKINQRPTAVFAQEIATNCAKGEKALQALEDKWLSQGKQLTSFAEHALAKFQQAQESWEAQLREERRLRQLAEARSRQASGDEQDPEVAEASQNLLDKSKVVDDLVASLESERKEVARLREKLSEAEQTIGQLVVQNIDTPTKAKKPSLRSRTRSALM